MKDSLDYQPKWFHYNNEQHYCCNYVDYFNNNKNYYR